MQATSADTIQAFEFKTSVPITPWESSNVTLLGDAIHSMTPAGGIGANIALRDASLLCRMLIDVKQGKQSLIPAIHNYEAQMLEYGFAAVKDSMRNTKQALAGRIARITGKGFLRLCGAVPPLRRAVFSDRWSDHAQQQAGQRN
ncbi:FAD-dependent oxidoreductase [Paenibacillus piri]|uniref:FAD-dependent oxidoreductase n=1 Tax=Paenibacillus piri TaxID=2547395 RepID=UPI003CCC7968